jgi:hypothetical protein
MKTELSGCMKNALFAGLHPKERDLRPAKRRYRRSDSRFTDSQVLLLVKKCGRVTLRDLHFLAQHEMPKFFSPDRVDYDKIKNAINRLQNDGKVRTELTIQNGAICRIITLR